MSCKLLVAMLMCGNFLTMAPAFAQQLHKTDSSFVVVKDHAKPWKPIDESDIAGKQKIWREINVAAQSGKQGKHGLEWTGLFDILCTGVKAGKIKAYAATDDKFTKPLTNEEFNVLTNGITHRHIIAYHIKEDLLSLKTGGTPFYKILGICPINKNEKEVPAKPLFWIYYPNAKEYLNSVMASKQQSWFDIFELRQFNSIVTKTGEKVVSKAK